MQNKALFLLLVLITLSACQSTKGPKVGKWFKLFNGKSLDGWVMKINKHQLGENYGNTFRIEDGILKIRYDQYGSDFNEQFGALHYKTPFSDYRLKVEYRFVGETAPGAPSWGFRDSGVQFHGQAPESIGVNQNFPICLEYNLHGGNGTDDRPVGQICAIGMTIELEGKPNESFCTMPEVKETFHGDQWVTLEIESKDGKFRHFVNGIEILAFENPRYDMKNETAKSLSKGSNEIVKSGYISLQSNSHPIDFRKIEIMTYK